MNNIPNKTAYLDLFSGIGGFALGAYWAGLQFDYHYFSEIDDYAIKVYQRRFPDAVGLGDIKNIKRENLPKADWIITGGFPCQDISVAGKGAGLAGSRSGLWYECARLIGELRPKFAIMENVGALSFRGLDAVLSSLSKIGYDAEWQDIQASDVGAPHRRERLWIVAYPDTSWELQSQGIIENKREWTSNSSEDVADTCSIRQAERGDTRLPDTSEDEQGWANNRGRKTLNECRQWWKAEPAVGRVADGIPNRVDRLRCLGNSIVPQIAELIFSQAAFDSWRCKEVSHSADDV
jgi:DNA (cytosine-5)-methyltransferase 1